jgi:phosphatidylglycerophosphatase A
VPIIVVLCTWFGSSWLTSVVLLLLLIRAAAVTIILGPWAESHWKKSDPEAVVSDEIAGQSLVFLMVNWENPIVSSEPISVLLVALVGFAAFRFFDITKPPPAHQLQELKHGWGILVDDLVAGIYAGIIALGCMYGLGQVL